MKLKTQIVVIALGLTASTSLVWSADRQPLPSPAAHTLHGTWHVTRTAVDCKTGQDILSFPAIMTFNQDGTLHRLWGPTWWRSRSGTEYGVWQREPGSHNYSNRAVFYFYTAEGDFDGRGEATANVHLTTADSFTVLARSRSSTLMGI